MKVIKLLIFSIFIIGCILFYFTYIMSEALKKGETHEELDRMIATRLVDSIKLRLEIIREVKGYYPIMSTKYFIDSIPDHSFVDKVYLYSDSIGKFIGIGRAEQYLEYDCRDGQNYTIEFNY